ncbi:MULTISPECIES: GNAT family N-acetyltransferase [unclassified Corynebacterium]|uniref:N-acetylglutamate synthase, CG3035 family n=1 Tax=unclassified Corynebacterium TaxID=2624378 RepID=UPI0029CA9E08|nr:MULTISPECIES: GNAT family N-acetyltransferase [unclassified Corynebacterium]WPF65891.1 GNAT family N-acetyltransferase [Corynebacterium sp. 22KM0430]WPF68384.1 GNAT family N-acetyltransferase [Corynebacterium sp. 21KM1197]
MSTWFRSQPIAVGDRVVVRRALPDTPGHLSDVVGHVLALDPLTVRPQKVGGLPSQAPSVTIPAEQVQVVRKLSPRRVLNSDIRAIEQATAAAFPGLEHRWSGNGQWLLRAGDGITERSNSATPLGSSAGLSAVPLAEIKEFYAAHGLPVVIHLPERLARPAEALCSGPDWERGPEILVMTRQIDAAPEPTQPVPGLRFRVDPQPDADWLAMYHFRGTPLPERALRLLSTEIEGTLGFGRLLTTQGDTVAVTRGTITSSQDGRTWLGYSAVEVAPAYRRRGLATWLGAEMLAWGHAHGAQAAYLQVLESNAAGVGLYTAQGFIEHHRHRYAHHRLSS